MDRLKKGQRPPFFFFFFFPTPQDLVLISNASDNSLFLLPSALSSFFFLSFLKELFFLSLPFLTFGVLYCTSDLLTASS